jgi:Na+/H+-dicarboxylate symporter
MKLSTQIILALVAGIFVGAIARAADAPWLLRAVLACEPIGTVFIRLISMVVVPLVVASLFVSIASLGDVRRLGRIGGKTLAYFLVTTALAATIGFVVAGIAHVGHVGQGMAPSVGVGAPVPQSASTTGEHALPNVVTTVLAMVPSMGQVELMPLIVAVCLFGAAATVMRGEATRAVTRVLQGVNDLSTVVIGWIMRLAPAAVFVLIAATVARSGLGLLKALAVYAVIVVLALAVHVAIVLLPMLRWGARMAVTTFFGSTSEAVVLALSTASSTATLPVSMANAAALGVPPDITSFMLPVGTTMNKNGAAVYKAVTAVFMAHLYGVALGPMRCVAIVLASTTAAFVGAGIPGSSLVTTMIVLNAIGLGTQTSAAIAMVAGIDRPLDMCRSAVNTIGNLVGTAVVARSEGGR